MVVLITKQKMMIVTEDYGSTEDYLIIIFC